MQPLAGIRGYWDRAAADYDAEADHGLTDPAVRDAWAACLQRWLPEPRADVVDVGCGTGSLAVLMTRAGHRVVGVDLSPVMVGRARVKCGAAASFVVGDAADPPVGRSRCDVVLARHLVWTLPDPAAALRRWTALLRPAGRLVLVEGRWQSASAAAAEPYAGGVALPWSGGVDAHTLLATLRPLVDTVTVEPLTDPQLWGRPISDERYAVVARVG